ncbi:DUF1380 family protein [Salmonella enterica]|nr:DUF1380 domain-containing protein [Salmonella enterica]EIG1170561.1 DUF1380 family protein [Salmonella enterica subsp. diarizonae serovar 48:k:z53]HAU3320293.1 DUF1380 domain-containing protein [Salmonella enterica subsp. diarizonae]EEM0616817.1 DUF1380 domain-containing protein [Salmonella enterica]EIF5383924.1 DUF1380 family protein [Salmonella enterica]
MMYGTRKELNSKLKRMFGNDERFALLVWTKQDVMALAQGMTEVEADAILREIGRKGTGEHTGNGISDSTVQALYAGLRAEIPTVSVPADLLARVTDAQAWPLVCQEYPGVAAAQADIVRLRQLALAA